MSIIEMRSLSRNAEGVREVAYVFGVTIKQKWASEHLSSEARIASEVLDPSIINQ
jgi:hypothetical protein